jgi:hypothetical protein
MDPPSPSGYFGYDSHQDEGFFRAETACFPASTESGCGLFCPFV